MGNIESVSAVLKLFQFYHYSLSACDTSRHSGSSELAAVGVSATIFNLVSKLFNVPLLNITTSFVAEEQALMDKDGVAYPEPGESAVIIASCHLPHLS